MDNKTRVFLDTTIQIERMTATRQRQSEIAKNLAGTHTITSTYVLGEYLRTLVKDAITLYDLVDNAQETYDVETQMGNIFSQRTQSRCILLWGALHHTGIYERDMLLRTLKNYINANFVNHFMLCVDELHDTTNCGLAKERPLLSAGIYKLRTQCTRKIKECELVALLNRYRPEIQIIADGLSQHKDSGLTRMSKLCNDILTAPDLARGRNCTWYLGDLVIALEMPAGAALYTTNLRHFEPLCEILGKQIYNPG